MNTPLLDTDGENYAVRWFLAAYGSNSGMSIGAMKTHLESCGYPFWPEWCNTEPQDYYLTKAGAQFWLRHLFGLEETAGCAVEISASPKEQTE